jgi:Ca2+-binding EF-hand superfamily protein
VEGPKDDTESEAIRNVVDELWAKYDKDANGYLSKAEFVAVVQELNPGVNSPGSSRFSAAVYDAVFEEFDKDGNGVI